MYLGRIELDVGALRHPRFNAACSQPLPRMEFVMNGTHDIASQLYRSKRSTMPALSRSSGNELSHTRRGRVHLFIAEEHFGI